MLATITTTDLALLFAWESTDHETQEVYSGFAHPEHGRVHLSTGGTIFLDLDEDEGSTLWEPFTDHENIPSVKRAARRLACVRVAYGVRR